MMDRDRLLGAACAADAAPFAGGGDRLRLAPFSRVNDPDGAERTEKLAEAATKAARLVHFRDRREDADISLCDGGPGPGAGSFSLGIRSIQGNRSPTAQPPNPRTTKGTQPFCGGSYRMESGWPPLRRMSVGFSMMHLIRTNSSCSNGLGSLTDVRRKSLPTLTHRPTEATETVRLP